MNLTALTWDTYKPLAGLLRPYIKAAVHYSDLSVTGVEIGIQNGLYVPVMFSESHAIYNKDTACGLMVLELDKDDLHVTTIAGDFQADWEQAVFTALVSIAKSQNRHKITLKGRKGWTRFLKPLGFKQKDNGYLEVAL